MAIVYNLTLTNTLLFHREYPAILALKVKAHNSRVCDRTWHQLSIEPPSRGGESKIYGNKSIDSWT